MGANCCVAAPREKPLFSSYKMSVGHSARRNAGCSSTWSFLRGNRTHIKDVFNSHFEFSHHDSGNVDSEFKPHVETDHEGLLAGKTPVAASQALGRLKSPDKLRIGCGSKVVAEDGSIRRNLPFKERDSSRSQVLAPCIEPSISPSTSASKAGPSSLKASQTSSMISRLVFDNRVPAVKSLNEDSSLEGRQSFVLPTGSNDLSNNGSQVGYFDVWPSADISEVTSSSQGETWPFGSEYSNYSTRKVANPSAPLSPTSLYSDSQMCGICLRVLNDRSLWSCQKLVPNKEISVVAILVCGHVFHANCLEIMTHETDKFDPSCPVCMNDEKFILKLVEKTNWKVRSRIARSQVASIDVDGDFVFDSMKCSAKGHQLQVSSNMNLRWYGTSTSSQPIRSKSEREPSGKKAFGVGHRRRSKSCFL